MARNQFSRSADSKPPKCRFKPGDWFQINGCKLKIIYIYRVQEDPTLWWYLLQDVPYNGEHPTLSQARQAIDLMINQPLKEAIVYKVLVDHNAAQQHFANVGCCGTGSWLKSTKQLLQAKKIERT